MAPLSQSVFYATVTHRNEHTQKMHPNLERTRKECFEPDCTHTTRGLDLLNG